MSKKLFLPLMVAALVLVSAVFTGCQSDVEYYHLIKDTLTLEDATNLLGSEPELNTYYYSSFEKDYADYLWQNVASQYKYTWTEDKITKYFKGCGLNSDSAEKMTNYLITNDYGVVLSRDGNICNFIMIY